MVADFFTKPLQGNLFRMMKKIALGQEPLTYLNDALHSVLDVKKS